MRAVVVATGRGAARPGQAPLGQLSRRQVEVLALLAAGLSNGAIADRLVVTERTVEAHVAQLLLRLGLSEDPATHRRVLAAVAYLQREGAPVVAGSIPPPRRPAGSPTPSPSSLRPGAGTEAPSVPAG